MWDPQKWGNRRHTLARPGGAGFFPGGDTPSVATTPLGGAKPGCLFREPVSLKMPSELFG